MTKRPQSLKTKVHLSVFLFICEAILHGRVFVFIHKMVNVFTVLAHTKVRVTIQLLLETDTIVLLASVTLAIASFADQ